MDYYCNYSCHRRKRVACEYLHRIGPAPRDEIDLTKERKEGPKVKECTVEVGSLDGNIENASNKAKLSAASKALLIYFAKMASKSNKETIDYQFLSSLICNGANVNVSDKYGQTVMHEIARNWSVDAAKFLIINGADVNQADEWGRTPLHLAAAVNHYEMVEFLLNNCGNASARTIGEQQTPLHYASKYNAVLSLKVLIDNRVDYNCRDYKQRTPIFLAADMAQEDSTRYLLDLGVPVGVFDDTGMSVIALMIEKMPHIAVDALNQFQTIDVAFRKTSFFLNYLEYNPKTFQFDKKQESSIRYQESSENIFKCTKTELTRIKSLECPATALEIAVKHCEDRVIMHPVMQQLIKTKWHLFGKIATLMEFIIHLIFCIIWTALGICLPRDGYYYNEAVYWRLPVELFGVLLTLFFILKQIWISKISFIEAKNFRLWRVRELNRDLKFCHPRWKQEKTYIEHEIKNIDTPTTGIFEDSWNILEFLTYASVLVAITTRIVHVLEKDLHDDVIHERAYAFSMIFLWLHFMKSCRAFTTIGVFISMLGYVVKETFIFAMLCVEISIPYMVGFWILFGGVRHAQTMERFNEDPVDWKHLSDLMFSVWQITLVADFNFSAILVVDKYMAQIMVGTFYALCSLLCVNLHIALLVEKFREVYVNARAHSSRLQATTILQYEKLLSKERIMKMHDYMQTFCSPLVVEAEIDISTDTTKVFAVRMTRSVISRLNQFKDFFFASCIKTNLARRVQTEFVQRNNDGHEEHLLYQGILARDKELYSLQLDIYELKCAILQLLDANIPLPPKPTYNPLPSIDTTRMSILMSEKYAKGHECFQSRYGLTNTSQFIRKDNDDNGISENQSSDSDFLQINIIDNKDDYTSHPSDNEHLSSTIDHLSVNEFLSSSFSRNNDIMSQSNSGCSHHFINDNENDITHEWQNSVIEPFKMNAEVDRNYFTTQYQPSNYHPSSFNTSNYTKDTWSHHPYDNKFLEKDSWQKDGITMTRHGQGDFGHFYKNEMSDKDLTSDASQFGDNEIFQTIMNRKSLIMEEGEKNKEVDEREYDTGLSIHRIDERSIYSDAEETLSEISDQSFKYPYSYALQPSVIMERSKKVLSVIYDEEENEIEEKHFDNRQSLVIIAEDAVENTHHFQMNQDGGNLSTIFDKEEDSDFESIELGKLSEEEKLNEDT